MGAYIDLFSQFFPLLIQGIQMTVGVLLLSAALSFLLGIFLGIFSCHRMKLRGITPVLEGIAFVYRAVPFYVQLLIVYFVFPSLLGFNLEPFPASVIALGMCSSGYVAQIVRGGMNSIPAVQWEAAIALSYGKFQTLRYIIFPQMLRNVLPAFNNELDSILKSTAIVSSIGLLELTRAGMNIVSRVMEPIPIYLMVALLYLALSAILNMMTRLLERKLAYVKN